MKTLILIALVLCSSMVAADRRTVMRTYQASAPSCTLRNSETGQNNEWVVLHDANNAVIATSFVAAANYTACKVELNFRAVGSPTMTVTAYLFADNAGQPGSILAASTTTLNAATVGGSYAYHPFTFASGTIASGTTYWVGAYGNPQDAVNHLAWGESLTAGAYYKSADAVSWSAVGTKMMDFKVYGN